MIQQLLDCTNAPAAQPLPTSRYASRPARSVLAILRAAAPPRRLSRPHSLIIAELQANLLLELAGHPALPIPTELITQLPRIAVASDDELPNSAMTLWLSGRWLIAVRSGEPAVRQRFSLAHELKHVIDHPLFERLYENRVQGDAAADYFAACLWMPKREVQRAWAEGQQTIAELATYFAVHPRAMARRLEHLGLRTHRTHRAVSAPLRSVLPSGYVRCTDGGSQ